LEGRLQIRSYEAQDGQKRRVAEVVANRVEFLDRAKEDKPEREDDGINLDDMPF
jgi:single-strand DNA-binding protein